MTDKYYHVRREFWENDPSKIKGDNRTIEQIFKVHKRWYMTIYLVFTFIALIEITLSLAMVFSIVQTESVYTLIFYVLIAIEIILACMLFFSNEKIKYDKDKREDEWKKIQENYSIFVSKIYEILATYNVDSKEQIENLKKECEALLDAHNKKFSALSNKVTDMLIGVPLGALIASLIYMGKEVNLIGILTMAFLGATIFLAIQGAKKLRYYADGYNKDKHLLNMLNELNYNE